MTARSYRDWNQRYVAFARSRGATDVAAFRDATPNYEYMRWICERWREWSALTGIALSGLTPERHAAFDAWLEGKVAGEVAA